MVEVNEKDLSIGIKETLTFDNSVQKIYDDIHEGYEWRSDEYEEESINQFLGHELTNEDKIEILKNIRDEYDNDYDYNYTSIFDEDLIRKAIGNFIEDNFHLEDALK